MENSLIENNETITEETTENEKAPVEPVEIAEEKIEEKQEKPIEEKQEINYDGYKPDSKFSKYYESDEETKNTLNDFNKIAKDNNLTKEQHRAIVDFMNNVLEKTGIFDTRTDLEKKAQQEEWLKNEKAKLGENADKIINSNVEFINNFGMFNKEQKNELLNFMSRNALSCSVVNTLKNCLIGNEKSIPSDIKVGGLADDYTLAKEYYDEKTSDRRREEIINQRIEAGRTGFLPLL